VHAVFACLLVDTCRIPSKLTLETTHEKPEFPGTRVQERVVVPISVTQRPLIQLEHSGGTILPWVINIHIVSLSYRPYTENGPCPAQNAPVGRTARMKPSQKKRAVEASNNRADAVYVHTC
jgi:hypothetical protein